MIQRIIERANWKHVESDAGSPAHAQASQITTSNDGRGIRETRRHIVHDADIAQAR